MSLKNLSKFSIKFIFIVMPLLISVQEAQALPAFARREDASCVLCHSNGSAPHLTKTGYLYRRAGFRMPGEIGDQEIDKKNMTIGNHMSAGVNFDYSVVRSAIPGGSPMHTDNNNFDMREVELWPAVGAFLGNYAVWSEIDGVPGTSGGGGVNLNQADLRYVRGNENFFINFRGGMIAPEGFGASDQWLDDGNIPLFDTLTSNYNQDTLVAPIGAMSQPQLGAEFGVNYSDSHFTLGAYNGFSQDPSKTIPTVTPAQMKSQHGKDYKLQLDQFVGKIGAVTATYYTGTIMLSDPTSSFQWTNHFQMYRLYLTAFALPDTLDIVAGGAINKNGYVTEDGPPKSFTSNGAFIGAYYYPWRSLTLAARLDLFKYNTTSDAPARARGYSLQASVPQGNNLFAFRFNHEKSDLDGLSDDFRAEWHFLF